MANKKYKKENEKLAFYETNFPLFQLWLLCKIKFLIPMVSFAPPPLPPLVLLAKLRLWLPSSNIIIMKAAVVVIVIVQPAFRVFARCRSGLRR
jgi:hypothetical protein